MNQQGREVVLVEAVRTPIGRGHPEQGYYKDLHPAALLARTLRELFDRSGVDPAEVEDTLLRAHYNPLVTAMVELNVPLVAAVNGVAAGAGVSLALACNFRIAARSARFQLPFVKLGLVPDAGATWLLPRIVGAGRAAEMTLLGRPVDALEDQLELEARLQREAQQHPDYAEAREAFREKRQPRFAGR